MGIYRICLFTFFIPCTKMLMIISRIYAGLRACRNKSMMRKVGQRMSQRGVPVVCCAVCGSCQLQWTDVGQ